MKVRVRDIPYFYERHQDNPALPTLVLLHGFLGSGQVFSKLLERFKTFCNPITIDLLGHGNTEGAELHYRFSTKEQVTDLVKLISEQLETPVFLYGYSMGARLALQVVLRRSDLIQGLILESGTFGIEEETERQARQALDASRADQIFGNYDHFLKEWRDLPIFKSDKNTPEIEDIQKLQNSTWMANSLLGFGTGTMPHIKDRLNELIAPTLLIVGKNDTKFIRINQTLKKEIPTSELAIIENACHRVHLDNPGKIIKHLKNFITSNYLV